MTTEDTTRPWVCSCRWSIGTRIPPTMRCSWCHHSRAEVFDDLFGNRAEAWNKAWRAGRTEYQEARKEASK